MTRDREIERVLDHWFQDGPSVIPGRVMDSVLDQVDRTPQRRLVALLARSRPMPTLFRAAALAAAVLVAVVAGMNVLTRNDGPGVSPTPAPPSPAASTNLAELPPELAHSYLGPVRTVEGLQSGNVSQFELFPRTFVYHNGTSQLLQSMAGLDGDDLVLVSTSSSSVGCQEGDEGRYPFSTSTGGSILTIEAGIDDCAARLAAVVGTWQRSDCSNPDNWCLGVVEAGTYSSQYFDPNATTTDESQPDYGGLTWTAPEGWANSDDWPSMYVVMRASSYLAGGINDGAVAPDTLTLLARASAAALHAGCPEGVPEPGVGTDRAALAGWLVAHPGLLVTEQPEITIDGLRVTVLDIEIATDWTETCDEVSPFIAAPLFVGDYHWAIGQNDRMRVILFDLPAGGSVVVTIDPEDPTTFDQLLAEAMPIVESFDFK